MKKLLLISTSALLLTGCFYSESDIKDAYDEGEQVGYHEGYIRGHDRGENAALDTIDKIMNELKEDTAVRQLSIYVLDTNTYFLSAKTIPNR